MATPNFTLVSELQAVIRRDFYVADSTILDPGLAGNPGPLLDGEWLELDSNYKLARGSSTGKAVVYPVHTERGRYDTQSIGKTNVLMMGEFEAETTICDVTSVAVGDALIVGDVTINSVTGKRGLKRATGGTGASGEVIVGICTKLFAGVTKLRFQRVDPRKLT